MHAFDYLVLAGYLALMLGVGAWFSRDQQDSSEFFLAGRSMGWMPLGLSVMATLLSALTYTGVPGEAYAVGFLHVALPVMCWLCVPLMWMVVLPLYRGLSLYSVYEYLEYRYDEQTRMISSVAFILWRLLWLGGVLYAPVKVISVAAGLPIPEWMLLVALGAVGTLYTFLGGMKAVIWTDVVQSLVMVAGVVFIIVGVWSQLDGGPEAVWRKAVELDRAAAVQTEFSWRSKWTIWAVAPHMLISMLSFYIADQITVQRFLTARDTQAAQRSFLLNCLSVSIMVPALAYVGVCLLAFYQSEPQHLRPIWTANVQGVENRTPIESEQGEPLLTWEEGKQLDGQIDTERLDDLIARGALRRPNTKEPFTDARRLLTPEGQVDPRRLAMRDTKGEWILQRRAQDELLPRFLARHLPIGVAGLILAALLAASMSSMDSGLNSICTLLITDLYRRAGWGRQWLAQRLNKPTEGLNEHDEMGLSRPLVLLIGVAATAFALFVGRLGSIFEIMIGVVNTFGGPLLAIFLLGVFSRRTTASAAKLSLLIGAAYTILVLASNKGWVGLGAVAPVLNWLGLLCIPASLVAASLAAGAVLADRFRVRGAGRWIIGALLSLVVLAISVWAAPRMLAAPADSADANILAKVDSIWFVLFSVAFSVTLGALLSLRVGAAKSDVQLRGLVVGCGRLGDRSPEEASIAIDLDD